MPQRRKRRIHASRGGDSAEIARRREDHLRPWPTLGYDREMLGMHMLAVEAFKVAESEFRRAIWLNPFEPRFKVHLAWCLFRQKRYAEARQWMNEVPEDHLTEESRNAKRQIEEEDEKSKAKEVCDNNNKHI